MKLGLPELPGEAAQREGEIAREGNSDENKRKVITTIGLEIGEDPFAEDLRQEVKHGNGEKCAQELQKKGKPVIYSNNEISLQES